MTAHQFTVKTLPIVLLLCLCADRALAQDTSRSGPHLYGSAGSVRIILGLGHIYGLFYGASFFVTDTWSVEMGRGAMASFNLGGGNFRTKFTGAAVNYYIPRTNTISFVAGMLYSYAHVIERTGDYPCDYRIIAPTIGLDISHPSGFSGFLRVGTNLSSEGDRRSSGIVLLDGGISFRFDFFVRSAPPP